MRSRAGKGIACGAFCRERGAGIGVVALLTVGSFYFLQSIKGSNPGDRIVASDTTGRGTGENDPYAVEKQGVQEAPSDTDIMTVEGTQTIQTDDASSDTDPADDGGQTSLIMTAMTLGGGHDAREDRGRGGGPGEAAGNGKPVR